jgi:hypothetical protein
MNAVVRRTMKLAALGAVALATTFAATSIADAQDALLPADQVIERHIEAVGGRDAILRYGSSRTTGTFSMPAAGIQGSLVVMAAKPNLSVTRVEIPGIGTILSGFDGEVGWSVDPNLGPRLLEGHELASTAEGGSYLAAVRDPSLFDARETVERTELNGQACIKIRLLWKSGRETFDCYSVETGLLVGSVARQESPMGTFETTSLLEEYRQIEGILVATRIRQQMMGQEQVMTLDTIEFDVVEPEAFDPPAPIQALIEQRTGG